MLLLWFSSLARFDSLKHGNGAALHLAQVSGQTAPRSHLSLQYEIMHAIYMAEGWSSQILRGAVTLHTYTDTHYRGALCPRAGKGRLAVVDLRILQRLHSGF